MTIVIPEALWQALIEKVSRPRRSVERIAYIDGVVTDDIAVATTIVVPRAELHRRFYNVPAEAMSQAGRHFRPHGLQRLAQVHTHGGSWVGHSPRDDDMAYSQEVDSISMVLPHRARHRPTLADAGVHVREATQWRELSPAEVAARLRLVPSTIDLRR